MKYKASKANIILIAHLWDQLYTKGQKCHQKYTIYVVININPAKYIMD